MRITNIDNKFLKKASLTTMEKMVDLIDIEIINYKKYIKNYPKDRLGKYGLPFIKSLEAKRQMVVDEIKTRIPGN